MRLWAVTLQQHCSGDSSSHSRIGFGDCRKEMEKRRFSEILVNESRRSRAAGARGCATVAGAQRGAAARYEAEALTEVFCDERAGADTEHL